MKLTKCGTEDHKGYGRGEELGKFSGLCFPDGEGSSAGMDAGYGFSNCEGDSGSLNGSSGDGSGAGHPINVGLGRGCPYISGCGNLHGDGA